MASEKLTDQQYENFRLAYQQLCISHRALDDLRAKLLVGLPLATGVIYLLSSLLDTEARQFLGVFGFVVTLGLYFYEFLANR